MTPETRYPPQSPVFVALRAVCPRCGRGKLFKGVLTVAPSCTACGLDYKFIDTGDGPAVFVIFIAGFLILGAALWVEFTFEPPMWVHLALWIPITTLVCVGLLRPMKALLIALQYNNKAEEARLQR